MPICLEAVVWNPHSGNPPNNVVDKLSRWVHSTTQVVVLSEARNLRPALRTWAKDNGFRLYQEQRIAWAKGKPKPEHGDVAVLIRRKGKHRVRVKHQAVQVMSTPWKVVRYQVWHAPRRNRNFRLKDLNDTIIRLSAVHWTTGGPNGPNGEAYREGQRKGKNWLLKRKNEISLIMGDLNDSISDLRAWANDFGAVVHGKTPDGVIARNAKVDVTPLGKGGSDHTALRCCIYA